MPFPEVPVVPGADQYAVPTPVFAPPQPSQPLPALGFGPSQPTQPVQQAPSAPPNAVGAVPIYTGGNVGPWGAGAGMGMFGGGGLPSLAGAFQAARGLVSGSAAGLVGGLLGTAVAGPLGGLAGRYLGNEFFGGQQPTQETPAFDMTPRSDLNALERAMREQQGRTGFGTYRGGSGFVTGVIDPSSMGIYEGSGMERSRAPQTSAMNQLR